MSRRSSPSRSSRHRGPGSWLLVRALGEGQEVVAVDGLAAGQGVVRAHPYQDRGGAVDMGGGPEEGIGRRRGREDLLEQHRVAAAMPALSTRDLDVARRPEHREETDPPFAEVGVLLGTELFVALAGDDVGAASLV